MILTITNKVTNETQFVDVFFNHRASMRESSCIDSPVESLSYDLCAIDSLSSSGIVIRFLQEDCVKVRNDYDDANPLMVRGQKIAMFRGELISVYNYETNQDKLTVKYRNTDSYGRLWTENVVNKLQEMFSEELEMILTNELFDLLKLELKQQLINKAIEISTKVRNNLASLDEYIEIVKESLDD